MFKIPTLPKIANDVLKNISPDLTNDDLLLLQSVFGKILLRAVELLDKAKFTLYTTPDELRSFIQIEADATKYYNLLTDVNYCICPAFKYYVLGNEQELTCKHVLAARLAQLTHKYERHDVSPEQMVDLLAISISYPEAVL